MRLATRWLLLAAAGVVVSAGVSAVAAIVTAPGAAPGRLASRPQAVGSWGLDRINQRGLPLDGSGAATHDGAGVTAYIVGSGIDYQHPEFGGRAAFGYDTVGDGRRGSDCHGTGTHVAGTVGGATLGVARRVALVSVRVLDCEARGEWWDLLAGLDWISAHAVKPAVVVVATTRLAMMAVDGAVNDLTDDGVFVAVAAGDHGADACDHSPAGATGALTVGATTMADGFADYSGRGSCVDLLAPGSDITSAGPGGEAVASSGTALAAAHVAGVVALYKQANGDRTQSEIATWLSDNATSGAVSALPTNTPDLLLYTGSL